jgi:hypothetical protein
LAYPPGNAGHCGVADCFGSGLHILGAPLGCNYSNGIARWNIRNLFDKNHLVSLAKLEEHICPSLKILQVVCYVRKHPRKSFSLEDLRFIFDLS